MFSIRFQGVVSDHTYQSDSWHPAHTEPTTSFLLALGKVAAKLGHPVIGSQIEELVQQADVSTPDGFLDLLIGIDGLWNTIAADIPEERIQQIAAALDAKAITLDSALEKMRAFPMDETWEPDPEPDPEPAPGPPALPAPQPGRPELPPAPGPSAPGPSAPGPSAPGPSAPGPSAATAATAPRAKLFSRGATIALAIALPIVIFGAILMARWDSGKGTRKIGALPEGHLGDDEGVIVLSAKGQVLSGANRKRAITMHNNQENEE